MCSINIAHVIRSFFNTCVPHVSYLSRQTHLSEFKELGEYTHGRVYPLGWKSKRMFVPKSRYFFHRDLLIPARVYPHRAWPPSLAHLRGSSAPPRRSSSSLPSPPPESKLRADRPWLATLAPRPDRQAGAHVQQLAA